MEIADPEGELADPVAGRHRLDAVPVDGMPLHPFPVGAMVIILILFRMVHVVTVEQIALGQADDR
jgi:hypothetical protein